MDDILMLLLSGDSVKISQFCFMHNSFNIFLLWLGPEVAVKAIIMAFGQRDLNSPTFENHFLNGSSSLAASPLKVNKKRINKIIYKKIAKLKSISVLTEQN